MIIFVILTMFLFIVIIISLMRQFLKFFIESAKSNKIKNWET